MSMILYLDIVIMVFMILDVILLLVLNVGYIRNREVLFREVNSRHMWNSRNENVRINHQSAAICLYKPRNQ